MGGSSSRLEYTGHTATVEPTVSILKPQPVTGLHEGGATHSRTVNWPAEPPRVRVVSRWITREHQHADPHQARRERTPVRSPATPPSVSSPVGSPETDPDGNARGVQSDDDSDDSDDPDYPDWLQDWESCSFLIDFLKRGITTDKVLRTIRDTGRVWSSRVGTQERVQNPERCVFAEIVFFPSDKARKFGQNSVNPVDETAPKLGQESIDRAKTTWTPPIGKRTKKRPVAHHKKPRKHHTKPSTKKYGSKPARMLLRMDNYNAVIYGDHRIPREPRMLLEVALRDGALTSRSTRTLMITGPLWLVKTNKLLLHIRGHFQYFVWPEFIRDYPAENKNKPWRFHNGKFTREHPNRPKTTTVEWRDITHDKVKVGYGDDPCEFAGNHISLALGGWESKKTVPFMYTPGSLTYDPETGQVVRIVEEPASKPQSPLSVTFSDKPSYFLFSDGEDDDDKPDDSPAEAATQPPPTKWQEKQKPLSPWPLMRASEERRRLMVLRYEAKVDAKAKEDDKLGPWRDPSGRSIISPYEFRMLRREKAAAKEAERKAREAAAKKAEEGPEVAAKEAGEAGESAAKEDDKPWKDPSGKVLLTPYEYRMYLRKQAADQKAQEARESGARLLDDNAWKDASGKAILTPYEFRMRQRRALMKLGG
ncbi:hypothetical protein V8F33_012796 [Rhypophila sp. PSN 637]